MYISSHYLQHTNPFESNQTVKSFDSLILAADLRDDRNEHIGMSCYKRLNFLYIYCKQRMI